MPVPLPDRVPDPLARVFARFRRSPAEPARRVAPAVEGRTSASEPQRAITPDASTATITPTSVAPGSVPADQAGRAARAVPAAGAAAAASGPAVPRGLDLAAAYAWRILIVGGAGYALFWLLAFFSTVTVPLAIGVLLAAMLAPLVSRLRAWGAHPVAAAAVALVALLVLFVGVVIGVGAQVRSQVPELVDSTVAGIAQFWDWIASAPFGIDRAQVDEWLAQLTAWAAAQRSVLAGMAAQAGGSVGNFLAGTATALMATFFFCLQGRELFRGTALRLVPAGARRRTEAAAQRGWESLVGYMRAAVVVALVDGGGIAIGAWALGVPLVAALFALTFFAAFIPLVGAVTAGIVAVALALVTKGWVAALIMLGVVVLVQQLEGNVLQPILLGQAAKLHPLSVLLGLIVGTVVAGITGALLSIPVLAFATAFARGLASGEGEVPDGDAEMPDASAAAAVR